MPIISSEIALYRSAEWTSTPATNGGRISANAVAALSGAIFPDVYEAERVSGSTVYRKLFYKVNNLANTPLVTPKVYLHGVAAGDHAVRVAIGSLSDTEQTMLAGSPVWHGCCKLKSGVAAGAAYIVVSAESAVPLFRVGSSIKISNKATPTAATGYEENHTVLTVSVAGPDITLGLVNPVGNSYSASTGWVSSLITVPTLQASVSSPVVSSMAGTVNPAALTAHGIGSVAATFTITISSNTQVFQVTDDGGGVLGYGNSGYVTGVLAPIGPFGAPLFTLQPSFWSGAWQPGDTVTFTTTPAATPLWMARGIPANSTSTSSVAFDLVIDGESS